MQQLVELENETRREEDPVIKTNLKKVKTSSVPVNKLDFIKIVKAIMHKTPIQKSKVQFKKVYNFGANKFDNCVLCFHEKI